MKVVLAKYAGFCFGVRNAVTKVINAINNSDDKLLLYGSLIHNPQFNKLLENRGIETVKNLDNIANQSIAIRTHGIPIDELRKIQKDCKKHYNLTCPRVSRVQGIVKKYANKNYFILIAGDKNHAEVIGIISHAKNRYYIISDVEDLKSVPCAEKYLLVSQTTFSNELFMQIADTLVKQQPGIEIINTICKSTDDRQNEVEKELSTNKYHKLIVIGGKNSANTTSLMQIGKKHKIDSYHIETEEEIDQNNFKNDDLIFITAGASTPDWIINNVLDKLNIIKWKNKNILLSTLFKITRIASYFNLIPILALVILYMTHAPSQVVIAILCYILFLFFNEKQLMDFYKLIWPAKYQTLLKIYKSRNLLAIITMSLIFIIFYLSPDILNSQLISVTLIFIILSILLQQTSSLLILFQPILLIFFTVILNINLNLLTPQLFLISSIILFNFLIKQISHKNGHFIVGNNIYKILEFNGLAVSVISLSMIYAVSLALTKSMITTITLLIPLFCWLFSFFLINRKTNKTTIIVYIIADLLLLINSFIIYSNLI